MSKPAAYDQLLPALHDSFVLPLSNLETSDEKLVDSPLVIFHFKFLHDRVQQAAYSLIDDSARQEIHYRVGRLLLESLTPGEKEERIFELVDHLNIGRALISDEDERLRLARLDLEAGQKALNSNAYDAARQYLILGTELLGETSWDATYQLSFQIYKELARAEYLTRNFPEAKRISSLILEKAHSRADKIDIYKQVVIQSTTHAIYEEAIEVGKNTLELLGEPVPAENLDEHIATVKKALDSALAGLEISSLLHDERSPSSEMRDVLVILDLLSPPAYISNKPMFTFLNMKSVSLSLEHGFTQNSTTGLACYAVVLVALYGEFERADELGELAVQLVMRYPDANQRSIVICFVRSYVTHWRRHLRSSIAAFDLGTQLSLESGNLNYLGYHIFFKCLHLFHLGESLSELELLIKQTVVHLKRIENRISLDCLRPVQLAVSNLLGKTEDDLVFSAEDITEKAFLQDCDRFGSPFANGLFMILKGTVLYRSGHYREALACIRRAQEMAPHMPGCFSLSEIPRYHALTLTALYPESPAKEKPEILEEIKKHALQMENLALQCPENFRHTHLMVEAEIARLENRNWQAQRHYEDAIRLAGEQGFIQDEALAEELAGRFWREHGNETLAAVYLQHAHQDYREWGAGRNAARLEQRYPQFLAGSGPKNMSRGSTTTSSDQQLDLDTVIRASRAIEGERELSSLLERVMEISLENAGAEKGLLVLQRGNGLIVKAKGSIDAEKTIELVSIELEDCDEVSGGIVQYVARSLEAVVLDNAAEEGRFAGDPYIREHGCKSVLCLPILNQGLLMAIVFMENNKIAAAFTGRRLEILKLLMTPAAVSIENALLKDGENRTVFEYQVGGSLDAGASSYVTRQADRDLHSAVRSGSFCYVLDARQMGKSTLRVRTIRRLTSKQVTCASIDITMIGGAGPEQWYAGLAQTLLRSLNLSQQVNLRKWWRENDHLPPVQRLAELIDSEILNLISTRIVVFIDEIDSVLSLPFSLDDFFALIRGFFNKRSDDARYQRLTFVLLGAASPVDLISDRTRTPFNIGRAVTLSGFRLAEAKPLLAGLVSKSDNPEVLLEAVLAWTGGQPFLTQKVCNLLKHAETMPQEGRESVWVGKLVKRSIIDHWERRDEPVHLKTISDRLLMGGDGEPVLLRLYHRVLQEGLVPLDNSSAQAHLLLTGLVSREGDCLRVCNRIYTHVFNLEWVERALAEFA